MTSSTKQSWARGGLVFAGTLMLIIGVYQIFLGIAAIATHAFFVIGRDYTYSVNLTAWGWIHLGIGVLIALAGVYLFTGSTVAKAIGIGLLSISAIANFFFLPYYPLWSLLVIGLDIFAIWAIATARTRATNDLMSDSYSGEAGTYGSAGSYGSGPRAGEAYRNSESSERWPAENAEGGKHWAPENVKEGAGTSQGSMAPDRESVSQGAPGRGSTGQGNMGQGNMGQGNMGQGSMDPGSTTGQGSTGANSMSDADEARARAEAAGRRMPPPPNT